MQGENDIVKMEKLRSLQGMSKDSVWRMLNEC